MVTVFFLIRYEYNRLVGTGFKSKNDAKQRHHLNQIVANSNVPTKKIPDERILDNDDFCQPSPFANKAMN